MHTLQYIGPNRVIYPIRVVDILYRPVFSLQDALLAMSHEEGEIAKKLPCVMYPVHKSLASSNVVDASPSDNSIPPTLEQFFDAQLDIQTQFFRWTAQFHKKQNTEMSQFIQDAKWYIRHNILAHLETLILNEMTRLADEGKVLPENPRKFIVISAGYFVRSRRATLHSSPVVSWSAAEKIIEYLDGNVRQLPVKIIILQLLSMESMGAPPMGAAEKILDTCFIGADLAVDIRELSVSETELMELGFTISGKIVSGLLPRTGSLVRFIKGVRNVRPRDMYDRYMQSCLIAGFHWCSADAFRAGARVMRELSFKDSLADLSRRDMEVSPIGNQIATTGSQRTITDLSDSQRATPDLQQSAIYSRRTLSGYAYK